MCLPACPHLSVLHTALWHVTLQHDSQPFTESFLPTTRLNTVLAIPICIFEWIFYFPVYARSVSLNWSIGDVLHWIGVTFWHVKYRTWTPRMEEIYSLKSPVTTCKTTQLQKQGKPQLVVSLRLKNRAVVVHKGMEGVSEDLIGSVWAKSCVSANWRIWDRISQPVWTSITQNTTTCWHHAVWIFSHWMVSFPLLYVFCYRFVHVFVKLFGAYSNS
jgi:hypothetical protein